MDGWYERRDELSSGMIFRDHEGDIVMLDRRVPGDGTKWYVAVLIRGKHGPSSDYWIFDDDTIEPGDLRE